MSVPVHSVAHQFVEALPSIALLAGAPDAAVDALAVPVGAMSSAVAFGANDAAFALPAGAAALGDERQYGEPEKGHESDEQVIAHDVSPPSTNLADINAFASERERGRRPIAACQGAHVRRAPAQSPWSSSFPSPPSEMTSSRYCAPVTSALTGVGAVVIVCTGLDVALEAVGEDAELRGAAAAARLHLRDDLVVDADSRGERAAVAAEVDPHGARRVDAEALRECGAADADRRAVAGGVLSVRHVALDRTPAVRRAANGRSET